MDRALVSSILDRAEVRFAYLFGSRASGQPRPDSDLDIAVMFADQVDVLASRLELMSLLTEATGIDTDVVPLNDAEITLAGRVVNTGTLLVDRDPPARGRYESLTFRMFADEQFHLEEDARRSLRQTAEGRR